MPRQRAADARPALEAPNRAVRSGAGVGETAVEIAGERQVSFERIGREMAQRRRSRGIDRLHHCGEPPQLRTDRAQRVGARRQDERVDLQGIARQRATRIKGDAPNVRGGRVDPQTIGTQ